MKIDTMNVSLPRPLKGLVQKRVERGGYGNVSEYIRELIREDLRKKQARERLDAMLLEGLEGEDRDITEEYWDGLLRRIDEHRLEVKKPAKARKRA